MTTALITTGTVFVSWWGRGGQNRRFISYGPRHGLYINEIFRMANAKAAEDPNCTPLLCLCSSLLLEMREQNLEDSCCFAAALATLTGWRFFTLQETPDRHHTIGEVWAKDQAEFESIISASLQPALGPLDPRTAP
jgi:hypothetical protein